MYHSHRYQLLDLLFDDAVTAFHAIGTVGGKLQSQGEQPELVVQTFHVRVVSFGFVEDEISFPVQRLQIGFDTCSLIGFSSFVRLNIELNILFTPCFTHQRLEYLLEERVLQFIVLHVAIHGNFSAHVFQQLHIPVNEFCVQSTVQTWLDDIEFRTDHAHQDTALCTAVLAFVLTGCRVAVNDEELELLQVRYFAVSDLLKYFAFRHRIVEVFRLLGGSTDFGQSDINTFFRIFGRPGAVSFFITDVHYIPMISHVPGTYHTAVTGNDISAENNQCFYCRITCSVQCFFPPCPVLVYRVRIPAAFIRIEVIHQQHIRTDSAVTATTGSVSGTDSTE